MLDFIKLYLGTLKRVVRTLTLGAASTDGRDRLLRIYNAATENSVKEFKLPEDPYIIPKTDILSIIKHTRATYSGVNECGFGHITEFELKVICELVIEYRPGTIFEIGTFQGRTTLNMALNAPEARIYTLDLPSAELNTTRLTIEEEEKLYVDKDVSGERFLNHPAREHIIQLFGDSATFDFSPYHDTIDFMFVDGSHAYEYVLNDTEAALKMVRKGGLIVWHDYTNWIGVQRGLNHYFQTNPSFANMRHIGGTSMVMLEKL